MTLIVAACDKPEAKPPTNIEKDEKADTDTDSEGESSGGSAGKMDGASGNGSEGTKDTDDGETAEGDADKADTDSGNSGSGSAGKMGGASGSGSSGETNTDGGEPEDDGEDATPAHSFAFGTVSHKEVFTAGTYTRAVVETNKPAGDARSITYTSSNNAIATVDNSGVVTFKTVGKVIITATKTAEGDHDEATASYELSITKMKPANKAKLAMEIDRAIKAHGNEVDLNYIDTSAITDMSYLFSSNTTHGYELEAFNGDISKWDVSKVTDMSFMFSGATSFNQDISGWNVSKVTSMSDMFNGATSFNQNISEWKVSKVTNMQFMFKDATAFNQDISKWDVSNVTNMLHMFRGATAFDKNLNAWRTKINIAVKADGWDFALEMFKNSGLADSLPDWCENVPDCKNRQGESAGGSAGKMGGASGSGSSGETNTDGGEPEDDGEDATPAHSFAFGTASHKEVFTAGTYTRAVVETNKPAGDARSITYTSSNNAIATVDNSGVVTFKTVGKVIITATKTAEGDHDEATASYELSITKMKPANKAKLAMEIDRAIKAHGNEVDLNYIDTSAITDMSYLFSSNTTHGYELEAFNGDISKWDVSKVTDMSFMFSGATSFNQDISGWNVSKVTSMSDMFNGATSFNQNISEWKVSKVTNMQFMFKDATAFNQDISKWDVSNVTNMLHMFRGATAFDKNLNAWRTKINIAVKADGWDFALEMFKNSGLADSLPDWCENVPDCKNQQS